MFRIHRFAVFALVVSACTAPGSVEMSESVPSTTVDWASVPTIEVAPPPTLGANNLQQVQPTSTSSFVQFSDVEAEVHLPAGDGPFPAVVTIHGGRFSGGSPDTIRDLSVFLAENGFLVYNTSYHLSTSDEPAFPSAVHDVACATRLAAAHEMSNGAVTVVGHSSGAFLGTLVALIGDQYGDDCPSNDPVTASRLIALGTPALAEAGPLFFGSPETQIPNDWQDGSPQNHTDANPILNALFVHAENDSQAYLDGMGELVHKLNTAEATAVLGIVPRIGHFNLPDPRFVGDLVTAWLNPS